MMLEVDSTVRHCKNLDSKTPSDQAQTAVLIMHFEAVLSDFVETTTILWGRKCCAEMCANFVI